MSSHTRATPAAPPLPRAAAAARHKKSGEIAALLRLAELDAALLQRSEEQGAAAQRDTAGERRTLGVRISREVLESYHRALRGGRQPAVARVVGGVCYGCFVRVHAKLDHQLRQQGGVASCPHCLRVVYDPDSLAEPAKEDIGGR